MGSKKACVFEEAASERGTAADVIEGGVDATAEAAEIVDGGVGQSGVIEVIPERFNGVEFGGVGGQPFDGKPRAVPPQSLLDASAAVGREPVP